jgi:hypothetical protein
MALTKYVFLVVTVRQNEGVCFFISQLRTPYNVLAKCWGRAQLLDGSRPQHFAKTLQPYFYIGCLLCVCISVFLYNSTCFLSIF